MGDQMNEFLSGAAAQGLFAVDEGTHEKLEKEMVDILKEVDKLCEKVDPEATPFFSKYEARKMLDTLCNKLEATKTIANLEKKKDVMDKMDIHIASLKVRLGTISWECEEPHNAQTDLESAAEYYFPGFVEQIKIAASSKVSSSVAVPVPESAEEGAMADSTEFEPESMETIRGAVLEPPEVPHCNVDEKIADAMKCLNMLGILWAGRAQVRKSLLYLLAAKTLYTKASENVSVLSASHRQDLESTCTHNFFYLAQAYGHVGDVNKSSYFCRETLQRQFDAGLDSDIKSAYEWSKNCAGIADFYQAMERYRHCAVALSSAEKILSEKVIAKFKQTMTQSTTATATVPSPSETCIGGVIYSDVMELEADISRRWARLDAKLLKTAFDTESARKCALDANMPWADDAVAVDDADEISGVGALYLLPPTPPATATATTTTTAAIPTATVATATTATIANDKTDNIDHTDSPPPQVALFNGVPVADLPLLRPTLIRTFEDARKVFLRAATR